MPQQRNAGFWEILLAKNKVTTEKVVGKQATVKWFASVFFCGVLVLMSCTPLSAQIGLPKAAWQEYLAQNNTIEIVAISRRASLLSYTVRPAGYPFPSSDLLYYLDSTTQTIQQIYASAFAAEPEDFSTFIAVLHRLTQTPLKHKHSPLFCLSDSATGKPVGYVYEKGGISVFSSHLPE